MVKERYTFYEPSIKVDTKVNTLYSICLKQDIRLKKTLMESKLKTLTCFPSMNKSLCEGNLFHFIFFLEATH